MRISPQRLLTSSWILTSPGLGSALLPRCLRTLLDFGPLFLAASSLPTGAICSHLVLRVGPWPGPLITMWRMIRCGQSFKAPTLQSVSLNLQVFDKGEVSVGSSPLAMLEAHLRASLLECWTTDAYLQIVHELSKCAAGLSDSVPQAEALELLPEVVRQTAMANARSGQSLGAGYVGNVVALRDVVLDRFRAEERTLNTLRGGDFTGPSLFGPLPESFASLLDTPQGSKLRCSSKASGSRAPSSRPPAPVVPSPVSGFKRPGPSVGPSSGAKRPKPAAAQSGRNPPFPKKPAGRGKYGRS